MEPWSKLRECVASRGGPRAQAELHDVLAEVGRLRKVIDDESCNCPCCSGACTDPPLEPFRQRTAQDRV